MTTPTINLNGTSASELLEQQLQVLGNLRAALTSLALTTPHARDYPDGDSYWRAARVEHFARVAAIVEIVHEVEAIAAHCATEVVAASDSRGGRY